MKSYDFSTIINCIHDDTQALSSRDQAILQCILNRKQYQMTRTIKILVIIWTLGLWSCNPSPEKSTGNVTIPDLTQNPDGDVLKKASVAASELGSSFSELLEVSMRENAIPRTEEDGEIVWATKYSGSGDLKFDWTLGFFPGSCWYMYEMTTEEKWKQAATRFQSQFEVLKSDTTSHDLGFVFYSSYGNGYRITKDESYKQVLIEAGNSLLTRYNEKVGCIQSWNVDTGWQAKRGWKFPVIIDNMMNLEMLFELSELSGDPKYRKVAISHADKTLENHFRADNSSYHVIDYDPETGAIRNKQTAQGFAHESAWARGQAWGLYGYVVCYRYTNNPVYLNQAKLIADFITNHPNLPEDGIPFWDYDATGTSAKLRDVSAAAITASALVELNEYTQGSYDTSLELIMASLASEKYRTATGDESKFLLQHSVGSIPHGAEVDEPLAYADYYYLEALSRLDKQSEADKSAQEPISMIN